MLPYIIEQNIYVLCVQVYKILRTFDELYV